MEWMAAALHGIEIPRADLLGFCAQNHIRKLALFGSILTDRFRPGSDVDVLVVFEPDAAPTYFDLGWNGAGAVYHVWKEGRSSNTR